jgi:hypothetical protein
MPLKTNLKRTCCYPKTPLREKLLKTRWYKWDYLQDVNDHRYDILILLIVSINFT